MSEPSDATPADSLQSMPQNQQADLHHLIWEGGLNTIFATLIGGSFLVGFALALGATDSQIGLLAALPPFLNLMQIAGSYLVQRIGSAKKVCLFTSGLFRVIWLLILVSPWVIFRHSTPPWAVPLLLGMLGIASLFASLSGISWMAWITPLVPDTIRGRFFGRRNMIASAAGMVTGLLAGYFVDFWQARIPGTSGEIQSFALLFGAGLIFGLLGWVTLKRVDEKRIEPDPGSDFLSGLKEPFRNPGFRRWMVFAVVWGFSVGLASPFFSVYMIRTLEIPFSVIALFGVISGLFTTLGMRIWGNLMDDLGSKPLLFFCSIGGALIPLLWLFAVPGSYHVLWGANILTGLAWSGIGLATSNLLMASAPAKSSGTFFAVFAAVTGLASAVAPLIGGVIAGALTPVRYAVGPLTLGNLQIMFAITAACRLSSLILLKPVPAAQDMPVHELVGKLESLSRVQLARSRQQMTTIGMQSWESANILEAHATARIEERTARLIDEGLMAARRMEASARKIDAQVDSGVTRWEQTLNRMLDRIVNLFKRD